MRMNMKIIRMVLEYFKCEVIPDAKQDPLGGYSPKRNRIRIFHMLNGVAYDDVLAHEVGHLLQAKLLLLQREDNASPVGELTAEVVGLCFSRGIGFGEALPMALDRLSERKNLTFNNSEVVEMAHRIKKLSEFRITWNPKYDGDPQCDPDLP